MRLNSLKMLSVALVGLAVSVSQATATPIAPGGAAVPSLNGGLPGSLTQLAVAGPTVMTANFGSLVVELTSWVYRETAGEYAGGLTFAWQTTVVSGTGTANTLTVSDFSAAAATGGDVRYEPTAGRNALLAQWDPTGSSLTWTYDQIMPGQSSPILIFKTKVEDYNFGGLALSQGGGNQNEGATFQPVPEPGALALAFAALPVLGLYRLRRRARS